MPHVYIWALAERDLEDIQVVISLDRPTVANEFLNASLNRFKLLAENPFMGRRCGFTFEEGAPIRMFPVRNRWPYFVFYRPADDGIEVIRVLDVRRDYTSVLEETEPIR